jgi:hypothetical protein
VTGSYWLYLACDLDDDAPAELLDELRWHIGLGPHAPERLSYPQGSPEYPLLYPDAEHVTTVGAQAAVLRRLIHHYRPAYEGDEPVHVWSLLLRVEFGDDLLEPVTDLVPWLAPYCRSTGWVGCLGAGGDPLTPPEQHFFVRDRKAYRGGPGDEPEPWGEGPAPAG